MQPAAGAAQAHRRDPKSRPPDPYRVFFPLGVAAGLLAVAAWPAYALGWLDAPGPAWHVDLALQGFLFAFVLGYLLTALPRISGTWHATRTELFFMSLIFLLGNTDTALFDPRGGRVAFLINMIALFVFAGRRFRKRKMAPPPQFILVAFALALGLTAACLRIVATIWWQFETLEIIGRRLISEGMLLALVLGVGEKLDPMLVGAGANAAAAGQPRGAGARSSEGRGYYVLVASLLGASFAVEYAWAERAGLCLRALAATAIFTLVSPLWKKPERGGVLARVLRFSSFMIGLSLWGAAAFPRLRPEALHFLFIGGLATMMLGVATRIVLTHGGYPSEVERRSRSLSWAAVLLAAAVACWGAARLIPELYFRAVAGLFWMVGLAIWGTVFTSRSIRLVRTAASSD